MTACPSRRRLGAAAAFAAAAFTTVLALAPHSASAQTMASINAQMASMNERLAANQQRINGMVRQQMANPEVQEAYRRYLARAYAAGAPPIPFANFAYNYIATAHFSRGGTALYQRNEAANQAREAAAMNDYRAAQANRGAAQMAQQDHFNENQREVGRILRGTSTFTDPNGRREVLPHTWQAGRHYYQGRTYQVDESGQYWVESAGGWTPLSR